jgi:hypothetical protein
MHAIMKVMPPSPPAAPFAIHSQSSAHSQIRHVQRSHSHLLHMGLRLLPAAPQSVHRGDQAGVELECAQRRSSAQFALASSESHPSRR